MYIIYTYRLVIWQLLFSISLILYFPISFSSYDFVFVKSKKTMQILGQNLGIEKTNFFLSNWAKIYRDYYFVHMPQ